MTNWDVDNLDTVTAGRLWRREQTALPRYDNGNDFQKGDALTFSGEASYLRTWEITHVLKNQKGVTQDYAILCIKPPDADYWETHAREMFSEKERLARSNAALRGQITKLRNRLRIAARPL